MTADFAITRDPATKAAALTVSAQGPWEVFAGNAARSVDFSAPVAAGTGPGEYALPGGEWAIFAVRWSGETRILAERCLPMQGGYNFRDLGGMKGYGGKRTVWGKLFRTDDLQNLTPCDTEYLASIPVVTIVDFRTAFERDRGPDTVPPGVKNTLHYPIMPGNLGPRGKIDPHSYGSMDEFMLEIYRGLVRDPSITATYGKFFAHVQNEADVPLLFHCSAGKDRTGFAAALILTALGVDRDAVFADYEASNAYLGDKYAALIAADPENGGLYTVKPEYLAESFRIIDEERGGMDAYLASALGLDVALLRARFLA